MVEIIISSTGVRNKHFSNFEDSELSITSALESSGAYKNNIYYHKNRNVDIDKNGNNEMKGNTMIDNHSSADRTPKGDINKDCKETKKYFDRTIKNHESYLFPDSPDYLNEDHKLQEANNHGPGYTNTPDNFINKTPNLNENFYHFNNSNDYSGLNRFDSYNNSYYDYGEQCFSNDKFFNVNFSNIINPFDMTLNQLFAFANNSDECDQKPTKEDLKCFAQNLYEAEMNLSGSGYDDDEDPEEYEYDFEYEKKKEKVQSSTINRKRQNEDEEVVSIKAKKSRKI
ncbi:uncharacterized protein ASCRUDRAFT_75520 [Ascoidea rubescens DSM 1968]|uniref:Uncharacterized protein n=1 Tax=Ascoidea rubescens DSM 1968 TaxID=1344418 RepID=A0A1D2VJ28_9ASCO|nr:hypothetical protein ASCRUDRAFT_75520 [Ascoidea rubescens DSM 1968]ODV61523.1 hypothetical protein ASCRUDRAFT_75520 [Ascoidea rubescens DSM 1968]